jgi:hypothetical protein
MKHAVRKTKDVLKTSKEVGSEVNKKFVTTYAAKKIKLIFLSCDQSEVQNYNRKMTNVANPLKRLQVEIFESDGNKLKLYPQRNELGECFAPFRSELLIIVYEDKI